MKKIAVVLLSLCFLLFVASIANGEQESAKELLPEITLKVPDNKAHAEYLGLTSAAGTPFTLSQIDADILMIELFSMYCPYCQDAAPKVNELYERMEKLQREDLTLKIIGIGANNTQLEVDTFRKGFDIPFPLFPDEDLSIYKTLAGEGTPTFIGCEKTQDGKKYIFYRKSGGYRNTELFLKNVLNESQVAK